ncbi:MAG: ABC transporter substrate-binding protein [Proteobacteria bacterium]|nr:ABC transporter substrate-binding protein [Pseudomonadota bacterium]
MAFIACALRAAFLAAAATASLATLPAPAVAADGKLTIGLVLPLSGAFANEGRQYENGIKVFQKIHGKTVAGLPVEIVTRDDQGPSSGDLARRLTQELIVRDKADVIIGYSFTPNAMAAATLLNEAKKPAIIVNAATSIITEKSPYFVRVSWTLAQAAATLGDWAAKNGIKTAYTMVSDYAPGLDAEKWFKQAFTAGGGKIVGTVRTPVTAMEYAPYLQRVVEVKPDALFAFNPGGDVSVAFMKATHERGVAAAGIKLLVTGDVVEENALVLIGDALDGVISVHHYQIGLQNPANEQFLKVHKELFGADDIPNARAVQAFDAMDVLYRAVAKTAANLDADALLNALKGMKLDSPRGPIEIDATTRDIVQNMYIRRGLKIDGRWQNVAVETYRAVADPGKTPPK